MSDINVFTIDDDFDPLADLDFADPEEQEQHDYLPPIPDAELSCVPEPVVLSAEERIEKLLVGIPGKHLRILGAVEACMNEPQTAHEIARVVDELHPDEVSVYSALQLVQLLEEAGALEVVPGHESEEASELAGSPEQLTEEAAGEAFLTVVPALPCLYVATEAGRAAVEARVGERVAVEAITAEPRYLPLYRRILEMSAAEGGCRTKELDAVIDVDPLCAEPRRFCGYFLGRLEGVGALRWDGVWKTTALGDQVLASSIFTN